jgi:HK97 family phage portal protein
VGLLDRILGRSRGAELPPSLASLPVGFDPNLAGLFPGYGGAALADLVGTAARCLQLVCQQVAAMPLRFRGGFQPLWVSNPDPVWFPNGIGDAMFAALASVYGHGDAFLLVTDRYETGYPRAWTVLDPQRVYVNADSQGDGRTYRVAEIDLNPDDVLQISRHPNGTLRSDSALSAYSSNVRAAYAAEQFASDFYTAGGVPWAVLQSQRRLTAEQAAELQGQWTSRVGLRGGAPAVLPPDIAFTQFSFSPKDLLLLESREWDAKQIAAAFGVPAFMLNMDQGGGLNYSNPEMLFDTWWRTELYPVARRIESALSVWLPRGSWVEFDPSILLRPDLQTMSAVWLSLLDKAVVTVDEVRAAVLDLPPLAEGDALALIDEPPGANASAADPALPPPPAAVAELGVIAVA